MKHPLVRRVLVTSLVTSALLCAVSVQAKEWKSITIATEGSYEPWNMTLPGGKLSGFEPELMADLCQRMKISCKLVVQNWDGMIAGMQAGKYDVIMDAIVITPDRRKVIDFTVPYASTPASFITTKSGGVLPAGTGAAGIIKLHDDAKEIEPAIASLKAALKGKTIGIASGTVYTPFIDKYFKDVATVREYNASADAILDLQAERIDAVFDDVTFATSILSKPENKDLQLGGTQLGGPIWGEGEALGIRKSDNDLKAKLDEAIKAALADGTVKKLSQKWFKTDVTP
ncbi:transporter substrate-binding domain-containing protein [Erwinia billingiae]|jgi:octopine/nopaline transport system substrate-binding protein|uniref:Extracellular solute-binding protein, family 3 n=1 Tax=Erwinia billingiae (strain Eb661) TaxID=634500 RepID=D8MQ45_ERWBE|nr:transporter substrate-binding domain-containing protein [Erwinia billingiae]MBN7121629.1 ABC transporter substrate-binding protein [Erwinia billingiae]PRB60992.1 ABC transporter substrate-binding protein [Erwinia billingiae]QEW32928.1 ABC transporter substrate-binding protein [Erwinia billingiae]CAX58952.1 Extracellular solute-binding protein, family 3 [Erwinia billingiae Eb661]